MVTATPAVCLHQYHFRDSSIIARLYTQEYGLLGFVVNGVRKTKPRFHQNLFQPLTPVEISFNFKQSANLQRLTSIEAHETPVSTTFFNPAITAQRMFVAELLHKCLEEQEPHKDLFTFTYEFSAMLINGYENSNSHLWFISNFAKYLGFQPASPTMTSTYFDLQEGEFIATPPLHQCYMNNSTTKYFKAILGTKFDDLPNLHTSKAQRNQLLKELIFYYQLHQEGFTKMNSHEVLEEVFGD